MTIHVGATVPAAKVRRIICLANEAHEIPDQSARLMHTLLGLCGLVGADVGAMFVFDAPQISVPRAGFIHGYSPSLTRSVMSDYATQGVDFDLMAEKLRAGFQSAGPLLAMRRQDLIDDRNWYNSSYVNDYRHRWGVDNCIYSLQQLGGSVLGMGLNRRYGGAIFRVEDQALVEIFHLATARVATEAISRSTASANDACRAALAPRAREILDCLLRGGSNKDIAEQLRLSTNTVHHYCKMVFRAFGVKSRSELVAKWFSGH